MPVLRRALMAVATTAVLVLPAACSSPSGAPAEAGGTAAPAGPGSTGSAAAQVDHTVPAPGPRQPGVLAPADIVIVSPDTLTKDQVKAIQQTEGVTSSELISQSTAIIENQPLTVAAVDPEEYRTFTSPTTADFQEAWDRVAGGEMALKKRLQERVPLDADGYLKLGAATDAPVVHVGAFIEQQPLIDAVVNESWIDTLGMVRGNAMLVRTGDKAPAVVQERLEKVLGDDAAVTPVDKASRIGLDPGAEQVAVVTGTVSDAVGVFRYTVQAGGRIAPDPAWVSAHISTEVVPILGEVTCNTLIFPQLKGALADIQSRGLADKIHPDEYAGCYYPRFIAGSNTLSNHAFGLALDLNVPGNGRGTVGEMDRGVVDAFKKWGFAWGGDWNYTDPMHFEMAQLVSPGGVSARK